MAEQSRGFRKFMLDPKSSVMTYIADNITPERLHQGTSGPGLAQDASMTGQQFASQHQQNQHSNNLTPAQQETQAQPAKFQSASSQPLYSQPSQASQTSLQSQPYIASNPNQRPTTYQSSFGNSQDVTAIDGSRPNSPPSHSLGQTIYSHLTGRPETSHGDHAYSTHHQHLQSNSQQPMALMDGATTTMLQGPPPAGTRRATAAQSAPRLYHRMVQQHHSLTHSYYAAIDQHNTQAVTASAYELEALSRRIWSLRVEHCWEFEGYSEIEHQSIVSTWHAQYDLWADTVLDIQEDKSLTSNQSQNYMSLSNTLPELRNSHEGQDDAQDRLEVGHNNEMGRHSRDNDATYQIPQLQNLAIGSSMESQRNSSPSQHAGFQQAQAAQQIPPVQSLQNSMPLPAPEPHPGPNMGPGSIDAQTSSIQQFQSGPPVQAMGQLTAGGPNAQQRYHDSQVVQPTVSSQPQAGPPQMSYNQNPHMGQGLPQNQPQRTNLGPQIPPNSNVPIGYNGQQLQRPNPGPASQMSQGLTMQLGPIVGQSPPQLFAQGSQIAPNQNRPLAQTAQQNQPQRMSPGPMSQMPSGLQPGQAMQGGGR